MTDTKIVTDHEDIVSALRGSTVAAVRITDEGIVTELFFTNGAKVTGSMIVEEP